MCLDNKTTLSGSADRQCESFFKITSTHKPEINTSGLRDPTLAATENMVLIVTSLLFTHSNLRLQVLSKGHGG